MSREVMQMALDMLNEIADDVYCDQKLEGVITALRQALETEQEPVATVASESGNPNLSMSWWHEPALPIGTKIYTSPQPNKQWVGLTDQELEEMHNEIKVRLMGTYRTEDIYRAIEEKLKEKNT